MRYIHRVIIAVVILFLIVGCSSAFAQKKKAPDTVVLEGRADGGVKFNHKAPAVDQKIKCDTCHHASKPEKPLTSPQEACTDCHTKTATPPMKTKLQAAFHNPTASAGLCIDCHKAENTKGKNAPTKCADCHKKENV